MKLFLIATLAILVLISGCTSVDTSAKKDPMVVLENALDKAPAVDSYSGDFAITYEVANQKTSVDTKLYKIGSKQRISLDMEAPIEAREKGVSRIKLDIYKDSESTTTCYQGDFIISSFKALGINVPPEASGEISGKLVCSKSRTTTSIALDPSTTLSKLKSQANSGTIDITYKGLGNVAGRPCDLLGVTSPGLAIGTDEGSEVCLDADTGVALQSKLVLFVSPSTNPNNPIVTVRANSFSLSASPQDVEIPGNVVYSDELSTTLSQILPGA